VQPIQAIEEVNMFKADGNVIHFSAPKGTSAIPCIHHIFRWLVARPGRGAATTKHGSPQPPPNSFPQTPSLPPPTPQHHKLTNHPPSNTVHASVPANTFAIYGNGEDKELTELVPGILNQLGPDSLASLRKLAESYQSMQKDKGDEDKKDEDDDDIPDLVEGKNFDEGKGDVE